MVKVDPQIHMEPEITKIIFKKKNKVGQQTLPKFKAYDNTTATATVWYQHEKRHVDQWKRIKSPETNPCIYQPIDFNKGTKTIQ